VNRAGFVIHSAVHEVRPDAMCVIHLHSRDSVAVSATEDGLLPLNQQSICIFRDVAFHDYEGIAFDLEERANLQRDLGNKNFMLLRNHGILVLGPSVGAAFFGAYMLEWCCSVQVRALSTGSTIHLPSGESVAKVATQMDSSTMARFADELTWPALLRRLDRVNPGYET
jgi:ribulose-5-phosphate 4-epimerase/fuculose-1-phosphate aldolase